MTKNPVFALLVLIGSTGVLLSQETPTATPSPTPEQSVSPSPVTSPTRNVRLSFVPPPLEGTISLGVYDNAGKLVRVLHQQDSLDAFTIGADALVTKWDGKDDDGQDLPPGKYRARGYVVGPLQVEKIATDPAASRPEASNDKIAVKLVANPLVKANRPNMEIAVGFDDTDSFLKTTDELPLYIISERSDITGITASRNGEKSIDVWQDSSSGGAEHFRISKLDQMMAFDCGAFELK
jgi:hypothetical protein